ncbi:MAG TPA: thioredoxin domain-containing protein [Terriglobales bacterium]
MTTSLNSLARASSAYLRSAMHQPVRWHEWSEEAFTLAERENKPILLDIGAVWCHWCHVMDRESYDSPEIAQIINEKFVAIKVDRDERPDIDSRYQLAVSSITGQGGWPLTAFLTPQGKPFYGGTYFPPDDHYGRPSFRRVLTSIANAYAEKNDDVVEQAKMVEAAISRAENQADGSAATSTKFDPEIITAIVDSALQMFDATNGGFGQAPKFPHPSIIDLLIDQYGRTGDEQIKRVFAFTLEKMARGGVYDQLAGGFHRYSVDERWVVPHFEKMSYDNSELLKNYVHAYQATGAEFLADVARDIIRWMDEWLSDRERGGFYSSQDADYSMDDDGDYFTWTLQEVQEVLSAEETEVIRLYYDVHEVGEMHHNPAKNVLHIRASVEEIAKRLKISADEVTRLIDAAKKKMYAARLKRPTPYVDKTVYTGWNAFSVSAYLEAAKVLGLERAREFALKSLDRILSEGWTNGDLLHVIAYSDAAAEGRKLPGVLDDYAAMANACLDAYEATSKIGYFDFAREIADAMITRFYDNKNGGFFDTPSGGDEKDLGVLAVPRKAFQDSPTPAGNPMAAIALLRLFAYTDEHSYREKAERTILSFAASAARYRIFVATYGLAGVRLLQPNEQVVIVGGGAGADSLFQAAINEFSATRAVLRYGKTVTADELPPALKATVSGLEGMKKGEAIALICSGLACSPPISDPHKVRERLYRRSA